MNTDDARPHACKPDTDSDEEAIEDLSVEERWRRLSQLIIAGGFPRERTPKEERVIEIVRERWNRLNDNYEQRMAASSDPDTKQS